MKKLLKVLGVILILIVGALVAIPIFFKDDIVKIVKKEANAAVNAEINFGDFDLSLIKSFPDFYLSVQDIDIIGVDQFDSLQLAGIKELDLVVDVMSVINGDAINVKEITLLEPTIYAKVLADGTANYMIAKVDSSVVVEVPDSSATGSFKMDLQKVEVINGKVIYEDGTLPMLMDIDNLNLNLNGDLTESTTNINADGNIETLNVTFDGVQYLADAKVFLDVIMEMDLEAMKFTFKENEIKINELPLAFNGWLAMPNEPIDMDLTFAVKESSLKSIISMIPAEFAKDLDGVETTGKLALDGFAKGTFINETYPSFGINLAVDNGTFNYPDLPKSVQDIQIKGSVINKDGDLNNTIVDVPKFHMNMAGNPFDANLYLATPISDPFVRAGVKGKLDLNAVKDIVPLEEGDDMAGIINADVTMEGNLSAIENERYEDFKAQGQMLAENIRYTSSTLDYPINVAKTELEFTPQYAALKNLNMQLGKSDIKANGRLENLIGYALKDNQTLKGNVNFSSSLLDINELAGIDPNAEPTTTENAETTETTEPMEAVILPKNVEFLMNATVGKLIFDNVEIENVNGQVNLANQKVALQNTSMQLLGGALNLTGFYETTDSLKPSYDFGMNIKDFNLSKTIETFTSIGELVPIAKYAKGNYSTDLSINGSLNQFMEPIFETLFGNGELITKDMVIQGYKPMEKLANLIKFDKINPLNINNQDIVFKLVEGRVFVEPFDLDIGSTKLTIAGSNGFDQTIDYVMSFAIPRKELGGTVNSMADGLLSQASAKGVDLNLAETINIDVNMEGLFTDPKITTDLKKTASNATNAIKDAAKEQFNQKKEELKNQAQEELDKKKQEAQAELERKKKEAEEKARQEAEKQKEEAKKKLNEEAKKKLKGLFDK